MAAQRRPKPSPAVPDTQKPIASETTGTPQPRASSMAMVLLRLLPQTILIALHGALCQLLLSPVYGGYSADPSQRRNIFTGSLLVGLVLGALPYWTQTGATWAQRLSVWSRRLLAVWPCYFPLIHALLDRRSSSLGPELGPPLVEALTLIPLHVLMSAYSSLGGSVFDTVLAGGSFAVAQRSAFKLEGKLLAMIPRLTASSMHLMPVWLSLFTSIAGLVQAPELTTLLAALPGLSHTLQHNPHLPWSATQFLPDLSHLHYALVDRRQSVTGYISILENLELDYRVMRCDHSLLGGEWLLTDAARSKGITGTEPVYAVFEMLEAVRLVKTTNELPDSSKSALVIGLGIGTAPKALLAHGIDTTIVELDPVVHEFATKYFDLPTNHTAVIQDAVAWTSTAVKEGLTYDYIIHDVFTGGAEPLALFTESFITRLRDLAKPDAVLAINFAGSVRDRPGKQVLHTIDKVFEGRCMIFRDLVPEENDANADFSNMVIFCLAPGVLKHQKPEFRQAVEADYLGSVSRRTQLVPRPELEIRFPSEEDMEGEKVKVLTDKDVRSFAEEQRKSAQQHWHVMRQVVYPGVWELW